MAIDEDFWEKQRTVMRGIINTHLKGAVGAGVRSGASMLPKVDQDSIDWNMVSLQAKDWAEKYTYDLVYDITDTSVKMLQTALGKWIGSGQPLDKLIDKLEPHYGSARAGMIASTEITRAYSRGNLEAWTRSDHVPSTRWRTSEDELVCPICGPLGRDSGKVVDIGSYYEAGKSSVVAPPAHIRCRCWIVPVVKDPEVIADPKTPTAPIKPKPNKRVVPNFKSSFQAEEYLQENLVKSKFSDRRQIRLADVHPSMLKQVVQELMDLNDDFPEAMRLLSRLYAMRMGDPGFAPSAENSVAYWRPSRFEMVLNLKYFERDKDYNTALITKMSNQGWWPKGLKTAAYVITHEFGHVLQSFFMEDLDSDRASDYRDFIDDHIGEGGDVSKYARTDVGAGDEPWAESFIAMRLSKHDYSNNQYMNDHSELLNSYFPGKVKVPDGG